MKPRRKSKFKHWKLQCPSRLWSEKRFKGYRVKWKITLPLHYTFSPFSAINSGAFEVSNWSFNHTARASFTVLHADLIDYIMLNGTGHQMKHSQSLLGRLNGFLRQGGGLRKLWFIWLLSVSAFGACGVLRGIGSNDTSDKNIVF